LKHLLRVDVGFIHSLTFHDSFINDISSNYDIICTQKQQPQQQLAVQRCTSHSLHVSAGASSNAAAGIFYFTRVPTALFFYTCSITHPTFLRSSCRPQFLFAVYDMWH
jgi:hypothetical protein